MATFPGENEASYYIPSAGDVAASGRLYQTYKFVRNELAEAGLITKRMQRKKKTDETEAATGSSSVDSAQVSVVDGTISVEYLSTHTDDKQEMLKHWNNSRSERFSLLAKCSIPDYMKKFPILSMADGFEWFILDFDHLYPAAKDAIGKWKQFLPKLMSYVSHKARRNPTIRDIIGSYDGSDAAQLLLSFKILPWILRPSMKGTKKNSKANVKRPNQLEVSDNFIVHFNTENDDKRKVAGYIEVKVIGSNSQYHTSVYFQEITYVLPDILSGIDLAFKLHYVFDLNFPKISGHVWEFLNSAIYEINTECNQSNLEVLSDILRQAI